MIDGDDECPRCLIERGGDLLRIASEFDADERSMNGCEPAFGTGTRLGPYEIEAFIARGGMGDVYRAHDTRLQRTVAIKVMHDRLARNDVWREHFDQEARAGASLNHPHICSVYDVGNVGDTPFVVMEFVDGETLASRLKSERLSLVNALDYGIQIGQALGEAHRHGIVHRDVKPDNIIITPRGIKLLDFGLAGLDGRGSIAGTPTYMAPEQASGVVADHRADLFSLGVILHEMIAGGLPFAEPGAGVEVSPLPPACPSEVAEAVRRCLAHLPEDRIEHAADIVGVLDRAYGTLSAARSASGARVGIGAVVVEMLSGHYA